MASMAEVCCQDPNAMNANEVHTGKVLSEKTKQLVKEWLELDKVRLCFYSRHEVDIHN